MPPSDSIPDSKRHKLDHSEPTEPMSLLTLPKGNSLPLRKASPEASKNVKFMPVHSDASPELPFSTKLEGAPFTSQVMKAHSSYNLAPRQCSAPVTSGQILKDEKEFMFRTHSESNLAIMKALENSQHKEEHLTGDFSQPLCLPVLKESRHPELRSITPETVRDLLKGRYDDKVNSYKVLDCRFPYEFEGGHIIGADNWHTPQFVEEHLEQTNKLHKATTIAEGSKRDILIFHCEFSAERGPKAQRLLRELDRTINKDNYPALHFPELYLLEGGYKIFFERFSELCEPKGYTKMVDANYAEDLKLWRAKSKTWAAENKQAKARTGHRTRRFPME